MDVVLVLQGSNMSVRTYQGGCIVVRKCMSWFLTRMNVSLRWVNRRFGPFCPAKEVKNRFFVDFSVVYVRNGFIFGG